MQRFARRIVTALLVLAVAGPAGGIVIGLPADPDTGNCYPFGCLGGSRYQQVYSAAQFSGPISIGQIRFFKTESLGLGQRPLQGDFIITLSTTSRPVNGLDPTDFDANLGSDQQHFATSWIAPQGRTYNFFGESFRYDPAMGNLLLDVQFGDLRKLGVALFLDFRNGNADGIFSRVHDFGAGAFEDTGLVTEFIHVPVPEPASLPMLALGLTVIAGRRRFRS